MLAIWRQRYRHKLLLELWTLHTRGKRKITSFQKLALYLGSINIPLYEHTTTYCLSLGQINLLYLQIDGEAEVIIPLDRIANEVNPHTHIPLLKGLNGYHLKVNVMVTESINNLTRNDSGATVFYEKPYIVKFASTNPSYFKAGLNYKAQVCI